jgi:hypothetical protein
LLGSIDNFGVRNISALRQIDDAALLPAALPVEELEVCSVMRDHSGQTLAYVYFEDEARRMRRISPSCQNC